jgi:hypothetical protein
MAAQRGIKKMVKSGGPGAFGGKSAAPKPPKAAANPFGGKSPKVNGFPPAGGKPGAPAFKKGGKVKGKC